MRFQTLRLRYKVRPSPGRELTVRTPVGGYLRGEWVFDDILRREVKFARLVNVVCVIGPDDLPPRFDPTLIAMSAQAFTLSGFERVEGVDHAQSWMVTAL